MKRMQLINLIFLLCLMIMPGSLNAATPLESESDSPLIDTVNTYISEGYEVLGPVQYLGQTGKSLNFYRQEPIAFESMKIINQFGENWFVRPEDFVYVLTKESHLILIRMQQKKEDANVRF